MFSRILPPLVTPNLHTQSSTKPSRTQRSLGLTLCLALSTTLFVACGPSDNRVKSNPVTSVGEAKIGGPFTLIDQDGNTVTEADFKGRPLLIYFGFAYCPDVCPTALLRMAAGLDASGKSGRDIQPLFISVDPERDTVEKIKAYVGAPVFPKGLIGLTGSPEQVKAAVTAYKVYATKVEDPDSAADYTFEHSDLIYLMGADGKFVDIFTSGEGPKDISYRIKAYKKTGT